MNFGNGLGSLRMASSDLQKPASGWGTPSDPTGALASLFYWLHAVVPRIQRMSPIVITYFMPVVSEDASERETPTAQARAI